MSLSSVGCSFFGIRGEEQPAFEVVYKEGDKEVRRYQPYIIAKTTVSGSFDDAQSKGFKILAGYIFGKNRSKTKISMAAPVVQKPESEKLKNEKIPMTAPVIIAPSSKEGAEQSWTMTFTMPSKYTLESLPVPEDQRVILEKVPEKMVAAHIFSGFWGKSKNQRKAAELLVWLQKLAKYKPVTAPMFAGYNPPWTLPFLRHNEMLIEIEPLSEPDQ